MRRILVHEYHLVAHLSRTVKYALWACNNYVRLAGLITSFEILQMFMPKSLTMLLQKIGGMFKKTREAAQYLGCGSDCYFFEPNVFPCPV
jgi:hypothetical protein